jgi:DNA-binding transcriptional regulator YiaG
MENYMKPSQLRKARRDANLTQEEAAALVYISTSKWRSWESIGVSGKQEKNNFKARSELFEFKVKELKS